MFRKLIMSAVGGLATHTSSLFFTLLYREIFQELTEFSTSPENAVEEAFRLGYLGAQESAQRQKVVFKLFPSTPEKILEFMPVLWQMVFGMPMEDYTQEWDKNDPLRPILYYRINNCPLFYEYQKDTRNDNLPWKKLWNGQNGYTAILTGMLTQLSSFILEIKNIEKAIIISEKQSIIRGMPFLELKCQIIPRTEFPNYLEGSHIVPKELAIVPEIIELEKKDSTSKKSKDSIFDQISSTITIDKLEDILGRPTGFFEYTLKEVLEKGLHMDAHDVVDHFMNYESDFVRVLGFLLIHISNEVGQLPERMFENEQVAKIYGHVFLLIKNNYTRFVPKKVIEELNQFFSEILEGFAPPTFIAQYREISIDDIVKLFMEGCEKALQDLGINFLTLKPTLYEEFGQKTNEKSSNPLKSEMEQKIIFEITQEAFLITFNILSLPAQFASLLIVSGLTASTEIFSTVFNTINESSKKIIELVEKIKKNPVKK